MSGKAQILKEKLLKIRAGEVSQGHIPDYVSIATQMAENIGTPDPELRDDLIYETFADWIQTDRFSGDQLTQLLYTCLDDAHAFYRIGESGEDSVFTRTFSLLVIALILDAHKRRNFLSTADLRLVHGRIVDYLRAEKDLRGYVEGKGWAHSTAHAADVIAQLGRCESPGSPEAFLDLLAAIKATVIIDHYLYINKEDERLATAVVSILGRSVIDDRQIACWLDSFGHIGKTGRHPEDDYLRLNVKTFLRSLYFRLLPDEKAKPVQDSVVKVLGDLSRF